MTKKHTQVPHKEKSGRLEEGMVWVQITKYKIPPCSCGLEASPPPRPTSSWGQAAYAQDKETEKLQLPTTALYY